jgi:hypothetical protein
MRSVLYYPHLNPDERWLRLAALTWDRVYTLGSPDSPAPSTAVSRLDDALGGFVERLPLSGLRRTIMKPFLYWIDNERHAASLRHDTSETREMFAPETVALHYYKFGGTLFYELNRRGLATLQPSGRDSFARLSVWGSTPPPPIVSVPQDVALYYLSACAGVAANKKQCDLFAEKLDFAVAAIAPASRIRAEVSTAVLRYLLPKAISRVPLDRLAALRRELSEERLRFQQEIQKVVDDVARVGSEGELVDARGAIEALALKRMETTLAAYKRAKVSAIAKGLGMASIAPGSVGWLASMLGTGVFAPAAIAAGLALIGASFVSDLEKARAELVSSGWSYIWELKRQL